MFIPLLLIYLISLIYLAYGNIYLKPSLGVLSFIVASFIVFAFVFSKYFEKTRSQLTNLTLILIVSFLVRLIFINMLPSDDLSRYAVEGKNINRGVNPYIVAPIWFTNQDFDQCSKDKIDLLIGLQTQISKNSNNTINIKKPFEIANELLLVKNLSEYIADADTLLSDFKAFPKTEDYQILKNRFLITKYLSMSVDPMLFNVNHCKMTSVYPPFALYVFSILTKIYYSELMFKLFFLICDLGIVFLIYWLLKLNKISLEYTWLYSLLPIVLFYGVGECHLDVLQNFLILLSIFLCLYSDKKFLYVAGYLVFGCAILTKFLAIVIMPFIIKRKNVGYCVFMLLPFLLYLPFYDAGIFNSLMHFSNAMDFADFMPRILRLFLAQGSLAYSLAMIAIFAIGFFYIILTYHNLFKAITLIWLWLLFCLPVNHPWYFLTLIIFICFNPTFYTLFFSLVVSFYFYVRAYQISSGGEWVENQLVFSSIIISFFVVLLLEKLTQRAIDNKTYKTPNSLDIIVPILNEKKNLTDFLSSLSQSIKYLCEKSAVNVTVYCVDGGSTDDSIAICQKYQCQTIVAKKNGRGYQLHEGFMAGQADLVLFLHADSIIKENSLLRLLTKFEEKPNLIWGVLGQRFENSNLSLYFIQFLNYFRFVFMGIAFGDQGVFCRRAVLNEIKFPEQSLMEDIELSMQLADKGPKFYLGQNIISNKRRWSKSNFFIRFYLVVTLCVRYLFWRRLGVNTDVLSNKMYAEYYQKKAQ